VRHSDFWLLMDEVFGAGYARTLASDQVLGALADRTAVQALADGLEPRAVWRAMCDAMEIPEQRRWGSDQARSSRRR
jgi:Protein of unknown function (DUF3046)